MGDKPRKYNSIVADVTFIESRLHLLSDFVRKFHLAQKIVALTLFYIPLEFSFLLKFLLKFYILLKYLTSSNLVRNWFLVRTLISERYCLHILLLERKRCFLKFHIIHSKTPVP